MINLLKLKNFKNIFHKRFKFVFLNFSFVALLITVIRVFMKMKGFYFEVDIINLLFRFIAIIFPFTTISILLYIRNKKVRYTLIVLLSVFLLISHITFYLFKHIAEMNGYYDSKFQYDHVYKQKLSESKSIIVLNKSMINSIFDSNDLTYVLEEKLFGIRRINYIPNESMYWNDKSDSTEIFIDGNKWVIPSPIDLYNLSRKNNETK